MKREYLFTHVDTIKKTNDGKLGKYTKHRDDMVNEAVACLLMPEVKSP